MLRELQERWQAEPDGQVRSALARQYERQVVGGDHVGDVDEVAASGTAGASLPIAKFFPAMFSHTKGASAGKPFKLERWQRDFVEELDRRDEVGARIYKRALLGCPRGCGKTPLAAGLALRELLARDDEPDVLLAAGARDQARIAFSYARGFVESGPLADLLQVGHHEIRNPANGGVLRTVSADGYLAHGLNPSAVVIDELWAWKTDKQQELFVAIDTAIHKRPDAFWLAISTAGHDKGSLLGRLYGELLERLDVERPTPGLVLGRDEFNGTLLRWYGADEDADADDQELWQAVNPASWVTVRDLGRQRQSPSLSTAAFKRLHLNSWVAPDADRWIDSRRWEELGDGGEIAEGSTIYVGADGSRSYDTTAIAWASRSPDGRIDVDARIFSVRGEVAHHVLHTGGTIDFGDVEGFLIELTSRFRTAEIRFDPRYLLSTMEAVRSRLPSRAVAPVEPHSTAHRGALGAFERAVLDGTIRHRGDPALDEQIAWTAVDRFENGDVRRVRKIDRSRPIDASVALALAAQGAVLGEGGRSVYEDRELIVL